MKNSIEMFIAIIFAFVLGTYRVLRVWMKKCANVWLHIYQAFTSRRGLEPYWQRPVALVRFIGIVP